MIITSLSLSQVRLLDVTDVFKAKTLQVRSSGGPRGTMAAACTGDYKALTAAFHCQRLLEAGGAWWCACCGGGA